MNTIINIHTLILNLELMLTANIPLYNSLKDSCVYLKKDRFQKWYKNFIEKYRIYNFDIKKASSTLIEKFNYEETNIIINILAENQSLENIIDLLDTFKDTISLKIYSNIKYYYLKDTYSIFFITILLLIISFIIVIYPISVQIINSLNIMLT